MTENEKQCGQALLAIDNLVPVFSVPEDKRLKAVKLFPIGISSASEVTYVVKKLFHLLMSPTKPALVSGNAVADGLAGVGQAEIVDGL